MPDWRRRRFLGTALGVAAGAVVGGAIGRTVLNSRAEAAPTAASIPPAIDPVAPLPAGSELAVAGISPLVVANPNFYRIDTNLLTPRVDAATWTLAVDGMVDHPFSITYAELLAMEMHEQYVTIACVSNEVGGDLVGNALWKGVRLRELLDRAGVQAGATQIVGHAFDGWTAGFPTAWLDDPDREALVAVAMNGDPLPAEHGFPARLIVPGLYGYVSATKWLAKIGLTTLEAFNGYWVPLGWAKEAPILTQSRIDVPKGGASVNAGDVAVAGVAWAPDRGVSKVEVQVDDKDWAPAELSTPISDATWVQWLFRWTRHIGRPHAQRESHGRDGRGADGHRDPPRAGWRARPPHHQRLRQRIASSALTAGAESGACQPPRRPSSSSIRSPAAAARTALCRGSKPGWQSGGSRRDCSRRGNQGTPSVWPQLPPTLVTTGSSRSGATAPSRR